ncbi:hypothetical protein [Shewanella donghaensis]|uniref:hypothetical protein n=1 Tax=Shewanella donghaensis TaxID=238836 RepID=UPI001182EF23|nr:hypothetical protein [Shewanella donghaensis]
MNTTGLLAPGVWASDAFTALVDQYDASADSATQHQSLLNIITHSYKLRKQADYCQYGAELTVRYLSVYDLYRQQNASSVDDKGAGFMQLSTVLNDTKQFDKAIEVCQKALDYKLSDGTVTGFEGRIKRIEKAKSKASD